jgi:hypothetical protein
MTTQKPQSKPITIRISLQLHAELAAAAAAQGWSVNDEINYRLRVLPVLDELKKMAAEIADLKALVRDRQK